MSEYMAREWHLFAYAIWFGVKMHLVYDGIRIFRRLFHHRDWLVNMEDFFFWCISSLCFFVGMYRENDGTIRFYVIAGMMLGALLYHFCISKVLMPPVERGTKWLKFKTKRVTLLLRNHLPHLRVRKEAYGESKKKKTKKEEQSAQ